MLMNGMVDVTIQPSFESEPTYLSASIGSNEIMISTPPVGIRSLEMGSEERRRLL